MPSITHAIAALNEGRTTEALAYCDHAIARYPSHMWAHFCRGEVLLARGENESAVPEFSGVIAGHPGIAVFYIFRGEAYLRARRTTEAIADFNSAIARVGVDTYWYANALALRSLAAELRHDFAPAINDFDGAMKAVNGDFSGNYECWATDATRRPSPACWTVRRKAAMRRSSCMIATNPRMTAAAWLI